MAISYTEIGTGVALAISLGWGAYGNFNRGAQKMKKQEDQVSQNLINNLKSTVEIQDKKITDLTTEKVDQGKLIANLQGQLEVVNRILENRDPQVQAFLKEVPLLVSAVNESNGHAKANQEAVTNLTTMMADFLKKITPMVDGKPQ